MYYLVSVAAKQSDHDDMVICFQFPKVNHIWVIHMQIAVLGFLVDIYLSLLSNLDDYDLNNFIDRQLPIKSPSF